MTLSQQARVGMAGAAVVGVAFGMARYALGLTLPDMREDLGLSELLLGVAAGATFAGYLAGLLLAGPLAAARGPRAPTMVGGLVGTLGCLVVALASSPVPLVVGAVLAGSAAGWVWAPYSDIVGRVADPHRKPGLLAGISTGTSGGLVVVGFLALAAAFGSWRLVWAGTAVAAAAAALLNLRSVPRLGPLRGVDPAAAAVSLRQRALVRPLGYSVAYLAATPVYFTYAADTVRSAGLPAAVAPLLYVAIGITGLTALRTGGMVARVGAPRVAAACLAAVAVALGLLAAFGGSLVAVAVSAMVYGAGFMTGSAVLAIWTAQAVPERAQDAFTVTLVGGSLASVAAPVVVGALVPTVGLPALLAATGVLTVGAAALVALRGGVGPGRAAEEAVG